MLKTFEAVRSKMEYRHKYNPRSVLPSMVTVITQHLPVATRVPVLSTTGLGRALNAHLVWVNRPAYNNAPTPVEVKAKSHPLISGAMVSPSRCPSPEDFRLDWWQRIFTHSLSAC